VNSTKIAPGRVRVRWTPRIVRACLSLHPSERAREEHISEQARAERKEDVSDKPDRDEG
jgi:hypothetical protein